MKRSTKERIKRACNRCGYEWFQRTTGRPKNCPNCGSPYYDKPRVMGVPA